MTAPLDICARAEEIRTLLGEDKVPHALNRLLDFVRDFSDDREHVHEVVVVSARFKRVTKASRQELLSFDEAERQFDRLLFKILALVDLVEEDPRLDLAA